MQFIKVDKETAINVNAIAKIVKMERGGLTELGIYGKVEFYTRVAYQVHTSDHRTYEIMEGHGGFDLIDKMYNEAIETEMVDVEKKVSEGCY